ASGGPLARPPSLVFFGAFPRQAPRPAVWARAHRQVAVGGALLQDAQPGRAGGGGRQGEAQRRAREAGQGTQGGRRDRAALGGAALAGGSARRGAQARSGGRGGATVCRGRGEQG